MWLTDRVVDGSLTRRQSGRRLLPTVRDLQLVLRTLRREPLYACAVVTIIATAIAANSAVFSAVHAILLRPLPVRDARHVIVGWGSDPAGGVPLVEFSYRNITDWASRSRALTHIGAMGSSTWRETLLGRGDPRRLWSAGVSGQFFGTLDVAPLLGRPIAPEDDAPNAPPVAVLSHRCWMREFGGDAAIVGRPLRLEGTTRTIVGVMPPEMDIPRGVDFWMPVVPVLSGGDRDHANLRNVGVLFLVGRLRQGVSIDAARAELDDIAARVEREEGTPRFGSTRVVLTPLMDFLLGPVRLVLWAALAAVAVVALTASANVAALMLARAIAGRPEYALRAALGAPARRLVRPWITEAAVLALAGGAVGLVGAWAITRAVVAYAPADVLRLDSIGVDTRVVAFTLAVTLLTALLSAWLPGRLAGRQTPAAVLNDHARHTPGRHTRRTRTALVTVQVASACVLLVMAGLVGRSFVNLRAIDMGFDPRNAAVLRIEPRVGSMPPNVVIDHLIARLEAREDVVAAGNLYLRPLALGAVGQEAPIMLEGQSPGTPDVRRNPALNYQVAGPGTFRAMGIPLKQGRSFTRADDERAPRIVVVGESTARRLWPSADPLGKRLALYGMPPEDDVDRWRTVVGVVADVRYRGIRDVRLDIYDAALQTPTAAMDLIIRTTGDPARVAATAIAEARAVDPLVVIDSVSSLEAIVDRATAPWRFGTMLLTAFAAVAVLIAAGGLFGVVALETAQASHELAIRAAVGAQPGALLRLVLRRAAVRTVAGLAAGLLAAAAAARTLHALLVGVQAVDAAVYTGAAALMAVVVFAAALGPAARAAQAEPLSLMRRNA